MKTLKKKLNHHLNHDCFLQNCKRGNLNLSIHPKPKPFMIVDMDCESVKKILADQKRCDFLFFTRGENDTIYVYAIEGKKQADASEMVKQLQDTANYLSRSCLDCAQFIPIAAGCWNKHEKDSLKKKKIKFGGDNEIPVHYWSTSSSRKSHRLPPADLTKTVP